MIFSKSTVKSVFAFTMALVATSSYARDDWQISLGTGTALSYSESIKIEMDDGSNIDSGDVSWNTKPFDTPPYYDIKIAKWHDDHAYEFEFIHHKIYAKSGDLDSRIQNFEVTDGYNLLYGNYVLNIKDKWNGRVGIGAVIPHPDVTVDGVRSHGSYQLGGITAQLGIEREFPISESLDFSLETKITYSYAKIDLDYGEVTVPNTALHFIGSIKYSL